jgi:hypothetical protein
MPQDEPDLYYGEHMKAKHRNGGKWTEARYRSFVMSALRKAQWGVKYSAIRLAYDSVGINPATKRKRKLYRCASCNNNFPQDKVVADHISPVVPVTGFDSWDNVIERMFCEAGGFQVLCKECHHEKSQKENKERAINRKKRKEAINGIIEFL